MITGPELLTQLGPAVRDDDAGHRAVDPFYDVSDKDLETALVEEAGMTPSRGGDRRHLPEFPSVAKR